jgi:hypothetical protein
LNYKTPAEIKNKKECYYDVEMLKSRTDEKNGDFSTFQYPPKDEKLTSKLHF